MVSAFMKKPPSAVAESPLRFDLPLRGMFY
jgi:hypothetical protein